MDYTQITLTVVPEKLEYLVNELYAMGIFELAIEDPSDVDLLMNKKEAYEWDYIDAKLLLLLWVCDGGCVCEQRRSRPFDFKQNRKYLE